MKTYITILSIFAATLFTVAQTNAQNFSFPIPNPPAVLQNSDEINNYIVLHYWDQFPFTNTKITAKSELFEQQFSDYLYLLSQTTPQKAEESITRTLDKAAKGRTATLKTFVKLYEKYLFDPNSPMRNEEQYIPVLRYIVASPLLNETDKIRPNHQLKLALRNRVGTTATDFSVTLMSGTNVKLSQIRAQYTLLYFNNPDCHDCKRVKQYMEQSPVFSKLIDQKRLMIFAIYPDQDLTIWKKTIYPKTWLNGYDAKQTIQTQSLYDLKAIPTLYLLDANKKVLIKDATVEKIEQFLKR